MPVIIELVSLIAPEAELRRATGAPDLGRRDLGARSVASDGTLAALAFQDVLSLRRAAAPLERAGLTVVGEDEEPGELAAADQLRGPGAWWPWLELARVPGPTGQLVLAARRAGETSTSVAAPEGWRFEGSATERHGLGPLRLVDRPLRHVAREPTCDRYRDRWTGDEVRFPRKPAVTVVVEGEGGRRAEVRAERVVDGLEVELGLMFREVLPPGTGMLFDFRRDRPHGFWMKNTLVPLDLLFVDASGRVVNVAEGARPLSTAHHHSAGPVRRVLEVPAGWCRETGLGVGARLRMEGEASAPSTGG